MLRAPVPHVSLVVWHADHLAECAAGNPHHAPQTRARRMRASDQSVAHRARHAPHHECGRRHRLHKASRARSDPAPPAPGGSPPGCRRLRITTTAMNTRTQAGIEPVIEHDATHHLQRGGRRHQLPLIECRLDTWRHARGNRASHRPQKSSASRPSACRSAATASARS